MGKLGLHIAVLLVGLGMAACSQVSEEAQTPEVGLAPQFGTTDDDYGVDVALSSTGRIYALVNTRREWDFELGENYAKTFLRRYDPAGNLIFNREVEASTCDQDFECDFDYLHYGSQLEASPQGNLYAQYSQTRIVGDCATVQEAYVEVYNNSGQELSRIALGSTGASFGDSRGDYNGKIEIAVDASGNVYSTFEDAELDPYNDVCSPTSVAQTLTKHSLNGSLLWQRTTNVGLIYGVTVNSAGNVYVIGSEGMARYSSNGSLTWTKKGSSYAVNVSSKIVASGSNLYVRTLNTIRKYDTNGKLLWSKPQGGLSGLVVQDITGDSSGNVYLSGEFSASSSNRNAFARKLNSSGSTLWTKTYGTSAYDDALGVATITGSEIYLTGETQGSLAHTNIGGRDGYLRKINSSGNLVWTR